MKRILQALFPPDIDETRIRQSIRNENLAKIKAHPNYIHRAGDLTTHELNRLREHRIVD